MFPIICRDLLMPASTQKGKSPELVYLIHPGGGCIQPALIGPGLVLTSRIPTILRDCLLKGDSHAFPLTAAILIWQNQIAFDTNLSTYNRPFGLVVEEYPLHTSRKQEENLSFHHKLFFCFGALEAAAHGMSSWIFGRTLAGRQLRFALVDGNMLYLMRARTMPKYSHYACQRQLLRSN